MKFNFRKRGRFQTVVPMTIFGWRDLEAQYSYCWRSAREVVYYYSRLNRVRKGKV